MNTMTTSKEGYDLIAHFEGFEERAYVCAGGKLTIGYGHTKGVKEGDVITKEQGLQYLREDVADAEAAVRKCVHAPLKQNQFDALVSFVFNVGAGNFASSSLLREVNFDANDFADIRPRFMAWIYSKKRKIEGLERRRKAEAELYCR